MLYAGDSESPSSELDTAGHARSLRELVALPSEGRAEAQVVEERRPKILDDPALDLDRVVDRRHDAGEPGALLVAAGELVGDELQIDLGRRKGPAHFIVDLARDLRLLLLLHPLQVMRQSGELGGALLDGARKLQIALPGLGGFASPPLRFLAQEYSAEGDEEQIEPDDEQEHHPHHVLIVGEGLDPALVLQPFLGGHPVQSEAQRAHRHHALDATSDSRARLRHRVRA